MDILREITQVITRLKIKNIEIIEDEHISSDSDPVYKLYNSLKLDLIKTDEEAAAYIYGNHKVDSKFTSLKNRLKNRLYNSLFFLEIKPPNRSKLAEMMYKSYKYLFWSKTLQLIGARRSFYKVALKAYQFTEISGLTAESVQLLYELRAHYATIGATSDYEKYQKLLQRTVHNLNSEIIAYEYYDRITMQLSTSQFDPEMVDIVQQYLSNLDQITPRPDSFYYNLTYFRIKNYACQLRGDMEGSIIVSKEAQEYIRSQEIFVSNIRLGEFVLNELACHIHLRQFNEGQEAAGRCREMFPPTSNTWFIFMEYYFLLALHTEHFAEAEQIYIEVTSNPRFTFQIEHIQEKWRIYEAYLLFALKVTGQGTGSERISKFDINKFLRNVPNYKKDKQGYNVSILILQIIWLLEQNDTGGIIDRMEALVTYRKRYLHSGRNKQSALFFKMLQALERRDFQFVDVDESTRKHYTAMTQIQANLEETQSGLQIIPYDWLWRHILEMLREKNESGKL